MGVQTDLLETRRGAASLSFAKRNTHANHLWSAKRHVRNSYRPCVAGVGRTADTRNDSARIRSNLQIPLKRSFRSAFRHYLSRIRTADHTNPDSKKGRGVLQPLPR